MSMTMTCRSEDYKRIYAIREKNRKKIKEVCPDCPNTSGIYFLLREEDGFRYGYIGQAKHLLDRFASHLSGYQHIDLSLRKHGFCSEDNPCGYRVHYLECPINRLDDMEKHYIKKYANAGYQMRNATIGGQGEGKRGMENGKPARTYHDGLKQGYANAQKQVAHWFALHLTASAKNEPPTKNQEKALNKFNKFINVKEGK